MTVLRNVDFSLKAVACLVFVTLNEFGVVWSACGCGEKMETMSATTGLISKTHLIDFLLCHPFVFLFNESTDMLHVSHAAITWRRGAPDGLVVNIHFSVCSSTVVLFMLCYCMAVDKTGSFHGYRNEGKLQRIKVKHLRLSMPGFFETLQWPSCH